MNGSIRLALNGFEVWAYVLELGEGYRMRLSLDDWDASRLREGRKIPIRMQGGRMCGFSSPMQFCYRRLCESRC
jgi:hypothetical protein